MGSLSREAIPPLQKGPQYRTMNPTIRDPFIPLT
jgi:hypothetical protein